MVGKVIITTMAGVQHVFVVSFSDPALALYAYIHADLGYPIKVFSHFMFTKHAKKCVS